MKSLLRVLCLKISLAHFSGSKNRRQAEASFADLWRLKDCWPEIKLFKVLHWDTFWEGNFLPLGRGHGRGHDTLKISCTVFIGHLQTADTRVHRTLTRINPFNPFTCINLNPSQLWHFENLPFWKITRHLMICIAIVRSFPICDHPFLLREQHNDYLGYPWLLKVSTLYLDIVHVRPHCNSILVDHNSHIGQRILGFFPIFTNSLVVAKSSAETKWLRQILLERHTDIVVPYGLHGQL